MDFCGLQENKVCVCVWVCVCVCVCVCATSACGQTTQPRLHLMGKQFLTSEPWSSAYGHSSKIQHLTLVIPLSADLTKLHHGLGSFPTPPVTQDFCCSIKGTRKRFV